MFTVLAQCQSPTRSPISKRWEKQGFVLADFFARRERIHAQIIAEARPLGGQAVIDPDLLDEVTGLVEWPVAQTGHFDQRFLSVPSEALISSMKSHQKYFHVVDEVGTLMPHFIFIANLESLKPEEIRLGNERVIRPRLTDADFFYRNDCRRDSACPS